MQDETETVTQLQQICLGNREFKSWKFERFLT